MVGIFFEEARPGELKANLIIMWREDNIIEEIVEDSNIKEDESAALPGGDYWRMSRRQ